jgi:hypothetical protein
MLELKTRQTDYETFYTVDQDDKTIAVKVKPRHRTKAIDGKGRGSRSLWKTKVETKPIVAASVWRLPLLGNGDRYHVVWHRVEPKKPGFDLKTEGDVVYREWIGIARVR